MRVLCRYTVYLYLHEPLIKIMYILICVYPQVHMHTHTHTYTKPNVDHLFTSLMSECQTLFPCYQNNNDQALAQMLLSKNLTWTLQKGKQCDRFGCWQVLI